MDAAKTFIIISLKYRVGLYKEIVLFGASLPKEYKVKYLLNSGYRKLVPASGPDCLFVSAGGAINAIMEVVLFPAFLFRITKVFKNINSGYAMYYNFQPSNIIIALYLKIFFPGIKQINFLHSTPGFERRYYLPARRIALLLHDVFQTAIIFICKYVVLPSEYSYETFIKTFAIFKSKAIRSKLLVPGKSDKIINNNKTYFSYIGHVNNTTGFDTFIDIVKYSVDNDEHFKFCIVTSTLPAKKVLSTLNEKYLSQINIIIKEHISDSEIAEILNNSICLFKFVEFVEQSGNIPVAYSFGTAVIGSDVPGIAQDIKNGLTGYTIKDTKKMPEIIQKMNLVQKDIKNISINCCNTYGSEYSQNCFKKYYGWL